MADITQEKYTYLIAFTVTENGKPVTSSKIVDVSREIKTDGDLYALEEAINESSEDFADFSILSFSRIEKQPLVFKASNPDMYRNSSKDSGSF